MDEFTCPTCGKTVATERGLHLHRVKVHGPYEPEVESQEPTLFEPDEAETSSTEMVPTVAPKSKEDKPKRPLFGILGSKKDESEKQPPTKERAPKVPGGPRRSLAEGASWVYGWLGGMVTRTDAPVGRAMQYQAPIIGPKFDQVIKGTRVDKLLQPLVKKGDEWGELFEVIGLPVMIAAIERRPELAQISEDPDTGQITMYGPMADILYSTVEANLVAMAKVKKKKDTDRANRQKALADLFPNGMPPGDPVLTILMDIFAPAPVPADVRDEEPEPAVA
jgi:hypothetical protein